jgi:alpha-1,6-mannosyltransferase
LTVAQYGRACRYPPYSRISASSLIWGAIGLLVACVLAAPVLLSHDAYSYVDYARLGVVHGLNPYVHPPAAAPFDPAYTRVTWIDATSAYGPLFTLATYPLAWLPIELAVAALKATAALSVLGIALLVARLAPGRGLSPLAAAAFVALNPVVLLQVVGGGHNDAIAMLLATLAIGAILAGREAGGGAAFVAAAAIKVPTGLAAPFALLATARDRPSTGPRPSASARSRHSPHRSGVDVGRASTRGAYRLLAGGGAAAAAVGIAAHAAFGWHWLDAIELAGDNQGRTSHMSVPITFARLTGLDPTAVRVVAFALFVASFLCLLNRTRLGGDWLRCAAWASFGFLLATAWLLPWYLIWALPLVALSRDRPLQFLMLALSAYQLFARVPL